MDNNNITELMIIYLNQMPVALHYPWNFNSWTKYIKDNNTDFFQQFYDRLSELTNEQLINMYKTSFSFIPNVIFKDLVKNFIDYSKKQGQIISATNLKKTFNNIHVIKCLLSYILVIEVVLRDNYFNRISELFGW